MLFSDYATLPSGVNITFKAPTNYIVQEGKSTDLVLEVQGKSAKDINVTVTFMSITTQSEWKIFLHGNMLCNLMFPVDFFYGLDSSTHLLQAMTTMLTPVWLQFQLTRAVSV